MTMYDGLEYDHPLLDCTRTIFDVLEYDIPLLDCNITTAMDWNIGHALLDWNIGHV
jgi:hypothetical protein